ncbi:MAG: hypothetical protein QME47_03950 [Candidatus Thermoplasmatota archaeon]|nr:hypothetical protein [Candidatus Thermoplasmatota archaeon]
MRKTLFAGKHRKTFQKGRLEWIHYKAVSDLFPPGMEIGDHPSWGGSFFSPSTGLLPAPDCKVNLPKNMTTTALVAEISNKLGFPAFWRETMPAHPRVKICGFTAITTKDWFPYFFSYHIAKKRYVCVSLCECEWQNTLKGALNKRYLSRLLDEALNKRRKITYQKDENLTAHAVFACREILPKQGDIVKNFCAQWGVPCKIVVRQSKRIYFVKGRFKTPIYWCVGEINVRELKQGVRVETTNKPMGGYVPFYLTTIDTHATSEFTPVTPKESKKMQSRLWGCDLEWYLEEFCRALIGKKGLTRIMEH